MPVEMPSRESVPRLGEGGRDSEAKKTKIVRGNLALDQGRMAQIVCLWQGESAISR